MGSGEPFSRRPRVFYAVLNMGLGHASRSLPLLQQFMRGGWEVIVGSSGRALAFLQRELPGCVFVHTPDYGFRYSRNGWLVPVLLAQVPGALRAIAEERRFIGKVAEEIKPDLIVSDHCYGMYHRQIPSVFLSHQIFFAVPGWAAGLRKAVGKFNLFFHRKYNAVLVPDRIEDGGKWGWLSGLLSEVPAPDAQRYRFIGPLSSLQAEEVPDSLDVLVSISGPEPQRSIFEELILGQIAGVPGRKAVLLGRSEARGIQKLEDGTVIYPHVSREVRQRLFNAAEVVVSRPGYSTLMELGELRKRAVLVPTPGQTEQIYLAQRLLEKKVCHIVDQKRLDLKKDVQAAKNAQPLEMPARTRESISRFFAFIEQLLSEWREGSCEDAG
jgi:UDP:flavonoid glycosyltransferase YjiC (YdhE family)